MSSSMNDSRNLTLSLKSSGRCNEYHWHTCSSFSHLRKHSTTKRHGKFVMHTVIIIHNQHFILGDFNAKLFKRLPDETEHIGLHIFNPDDRDIHEIPEAQLENRELFVEFCLERDCIVASIWFQKSRHELVTFRNTNASTFRPPFANTRFSQIDYVLVRKQWRNPFRK